MAESKTAVHGAIAANVAIATTRFIVAGMTGSSAMLSEAVHSTVDTGNGLLLLVGMHRSKRPASRDHPFWRSLHTSKDPSVYTVLAEDGAALLGLALAAGGVYASHALDLLVLDGAASVAIGILLAGVAVLLVRESHGLLIGEGVRRETADAIVALAEARPAVARAQPPLSMYLGSDEMLLAMDVEFVHGTSADTVVDTVEAIEREIAKRYPRINRIYIEAKRDAARP